MRDARGSTTVGSWCYSLVAARTKGFMTVTACSLDGREHFLAPGCHPSGQRARVDEDDEADVGGHLVLMVLHTVLWTSSVIKLR